MIFSRMCVRLYSREEKRKIVWSCLNNFYLSNL